MAAGDSASAANLSLNEVLKAVEHHNLHLSPEDIRLLRLKIVYGDDVQCRKQSGDKNAGKDSNDPNKLVVDFCKKQKIVLDTEDIIPKAISIWPSFRGKKYFSTLKLNYGSYESPLLKDTKACTSGFVYNGKPFVFKKLIPGMYMSEYGFQKTMEKIFKDMLTAEKVVVYLDIVYVFGKTEDELYSNVGKVFEKLSKSSLPLDNAVCTIFQKSVELLGYRVSNGKLKIPPKIVDVIKSIKRPETVIELFEFMAVAGFYKEMIKGFARLAAPLTELMDAPQSVVKNVDWQQQHQISFEVLQKKLLNKPVLSICDEKAEKILYVTSSKIAIEGDLYQIDLKTKEKEAIGHFSAKVKSDMKNWEAFDLEMLAIAESCQYFQPYLKKSFTVYTVNPSQMYKNRFKNPTARLKKLKSKIGSFSFKVRQAITAGAANTDFYEFTKKI